MEGNSKVSAADGINRRDRLDYWQLMDMIEAAASRAPIAGFAMVELMPDCDINGRGALLASRIAISVLGFIARQRAAR